MGEDLNQEGKRMISQGILPFKIEHTEEQITPRSGVALFAEVIRALDVRRKVGTAIHAMAKKGEPFRLVIQRWRDPQLPLFQKPGYCYYVIATNRDDQSPEDIIRFHNERGQAENEIKELKMRSSPKILGREEPLLAGFEISGGKTAVKAALLAEEIGLDPIGQGIEAEVWNAEHAAGRQEHVSG
jgi:hypothetical protein